MTQLLIPEYVAIDYQQKIDESRRLLLVCAERILPADDYAAMADSPDYVAVSLDDPNRVSYSDGCDKYDYKRRKITTLHRFFSRRLKRTVCDRLLSRVVGAYGGSLSGFTMRDDVSAVYADEDGPESCMTSDDAQDWVSWYDGHCEILTYHSPTCGGKFARALVWEGKYIDRIYPNDDRIIEAYTMYADENGMKMLDKNSYAQSWGEDVSVVMPVPDSGFPYMDTLRYWDGERISTRHIGITLDSTDGGPSRVYCEYCNKDVLEEDWNDSYDRCTSCVDDMNYCDGCDRYTDSDLLATTEGDRCDDCCENMAYCGSCERYTNEYTVVNDECLCEECFQELPCCDGCCSRESDLTDTDNGSLCNECIQAGQTSTTNETSTPTGATD